MKNLIVLLAICNIAVVPAIAQTKKPVKKTTTTTKAPTKPTEKVNVTSKNQSAKQTKSHISTTNYKAALGLKFIYGISLTGKFFLNEKTALEGIVRYNSAGGSGSNIAFSGLYEYHADIKGVDGLRWYLGGGGHVNHMSWKNGYGDPVTTFGVVGIVGLEYKFKSLPIAISADWQPGYIISSGYGFSAENGGIGIKYTF